MKVLHHHIYEYKKGLRNLVLHTMPACELMEAEELLQRQGIVYLIQNINPAKVNIFFGKEQCVRIIQSFNKISPAEFTHEEDSISGIMLGDYRMPQCERYTKRKGWIVQNCKKGREYTAFMINNRIHE